MITTGVCLHDRLQGELRLNSLISKLESLVLGAPYVPVSWTRRLQGHYGDASAKEE